ncbi:uncharacterized protein LOC118736455 [Rhagoletis pomonella]|uniref:uncharacterized protein LOC118736455 n=1 Tax=Rhagoletis pomonella TaxID=28610 RepID=UPI001782B2A9|nr:uncharacterized protein LOC118736455 [Rhagoletis pomonella]
MQRIINGYFKYFEPLRYGVNVVSQLEEYPATLFQTNSSTQRPSEMVVSTSLKPIEVMRESKEEATTSHLPQNEILTAPMSTEAPKEDNLQPQSQSDAVAEESTKKILTMIEKARQLQIRHRLD